MLRVNHLVARGERNLIPLLGIMLVPPIPVIIHRLNHLGITLIIPKGRMISSCFAPEALSVGSSMAAFLMRYPRKGDHAVKAALVVRQSDTNTSMNVVIIMS